jgi:hypothetical protein
MHRGFTRLLRRHSVALLALFLALGGTSYAASTLVKTRTKERTSAADLERLCVGLEGQEPDGGSRREQKPPTPVAAN